MGDIFQRRWGHTAGSLQYSGAVCAVCEDTSQERRGNDTLHRTEAVADLAGVHRGGYTVTRPRGGTGQPVQGETADSTGSVSVSLSEWISQ